MRPAGYCATTPSAHETGSPGSSSCSTPSHRPDHPAHHQPHRNRRHPGQNPPRPAPITLPAPIATLAQQYLARPRGHATTGAGTPSPWLFPRCSGGRSPPATAGPGSKPSASTQRKTRSTALFQLATELPAGILARMLGIHIGDTVAWQHASAGDWTTYAASISRRSRQP